ncbi:DUF3054 domain-containing protein [Agromyces marinus]|nr:DUF3054 domain-containing protein [Agromyces marinus]
MSGTAPTHRTPTGPQRTSTGTVLAAIAVDAVLVVVFAALGRGSHSETLDASGIWATAWPFLVGLAAGWVVIRGWRHPLAVLPTGVVVWVATLALGMLLRLATGAGTALAFVIVATLTLGVLLVGWRGAAALVRRLRARAGAPHAR